MGGRALAREQRRRALVILLAGAFAQGSLCLRAGREVR